MHTACEITVAPPEVLYCELYRPLVVFCLNFHKCRAHGGRVQLCHSFRCNSDDLVTPRDKLVQLNLRRLDLITQHFDLVAQLLTLICLFYLLY